MRFIYSFQKVLDVKTNEKKQAEGELSQSIATMTQAERELKDVVRRKAEAGQLLSERVNAKGTAAELMQIQQYIEYLDTLIHRAERNAAAAELQVNERREQLTVCTVEEKVWLKAKEKAFTEFRQETERRAQSEIDEIALMRARFAH